MIQAHKDNIQIKPKTKLTTKTLTFNPSSHIDFNLSDLLTAQSQASEGQSEFKKTMGKSRLNLKSAMFSFHNNDEKSNSGTSDPDQNIIRSTQDESIKEPIVDNSNKENLEEMPRTNPDPEEQKFLEPKPAHEVQIEIIVWMSRAQFAQAVTDLSKTLKDKHVQALEGFKNREIIKEIPEPAQRTHYTKKKYQNNKPQEVKTDAKIIRETAILEPQKEGMMIQRKELTEEERAWKERLSSSAAKTWLKGKQEAVDPDEALKKEIKFNLNLLTAENFEKIKDIILNISCQNMSNCEKVAEFIVENAWTQKKYINTYARLCAYLGKQESLEFNNNGKNDFKLQVLKHIQTVFEDESEQTDANKEGADQAALNKKRMQKIIGNICFIGELFLEKFLPLAVVRIVTSSFLNKFIGQYEKSKKSSEVDQKERLYEETLEGLIKFYDIIGKSLEEKEASLKKKNNKRDIVPCFKEVLCQINSRGKSSDFSIDDEDISTEKVFKILDVILREAELTPRLDSLIKNLKYRRDNGWITSLTTQQGPKTFKELHQEFEKEKMEEERRGEEYRQELKTSYNHSKPNQKKDSKPVFQVATGTKEEGKKPASDKVVGGSISIDVTPGMFGRPVRPGKNNKQTLSKPKISQEEIERDLKEIYRIVNNKESDGVEQLKTLIKKAESQDILTVYLKTFFDGRLEAVKERYFIHNILFETVQKDEFLEIFMERANQLYDILCDYPGLDKHFAIILLDYCRKTDDIVDGIRFEESFYESEDSEFVLEFYQEMVKQLQRALDEDYQDLKEKIGRDVIQKLAERVRVNDIESL